jgi:isocitrate dehydrogenase kinase/phosphatase
MEKGRFTLAMSPECIIDVSEIDEKSWNRIKANVRKLFESKQCKTAGEAYFCAFMIYLTEFNQLIPEYDPSKDRMM